MSLGYNKEKVLPNLIHAVFGLLFVIYPLSHTIALRNILISLGAIISSYFLLRYKIKLSKCIRIVLFLISLFYLILYITPLIIGELNEGVLKELGGLWVRVIGLIIIGFIVGITLNKNNSLIKYSVFSIVIILIFDYYLYIREVIESGELYLTFIGLYQSKIQANFYLFIPFTIITSIILYEILKNQPIKLYEILLGIALIYLIALTKSLNSLIILLLFSIYIISQLFKIETKKYSLFIMLIIFCTVFSLYIMTDKNGRKKLQNISSDIFYSILIEDDNWKRTDNKEINPINPATKSEIYTSTYERVSWFKQGIKVLLNNPFGYGYTYLPFKRGLQELYGSNVNATKTHSGWIDLAIGIGLLNVIILHCIIATIVYYSVKNYSKVNSAFHFSIIIFMIIYYVYWWIGELSEREIIETYFLSISIAAGLNNEI